MTRAPEHNDDTCTRLAGGINPRRSFLLGTRQYVLSRPPALGLIQQLCENSSPALHCRQADLHEHAVLELSDDACLAR